MWQSFPEPGHSPEKNNHLWEQLCFILEDGVAGKVWQKKIIGESLCVIFRVYLPPKPLEVLMVEHQKLHAIYTSLPWWILPTYCSTITHLHSREHSLSLTQPQTAFRWRPLNMPQLEESREVGDSNPVCMPFADRLCDWNSRQALNSSSMITKPAEPMGAMGRNIFMDHPIAVLSKETCPGRRLKRKTFHRCQLRLSK